MFKATIKAQENDHFNAIVPQTLREKLRAIAEAVKDDFIGSPGASFKEAFGCSDITAIYGRRISGFIPAQLGGFEVTELFRSDTDSSYHFTKAQSEWAIKQEKYMYESFRRDNPELKLEENFGYDDLPESEQNAFSDYERDWFEPALLRFEIWVDDKDNRLGFGNDGKKADRVFIRLGLNYSDAPYYRSGSDDEVLVKAEFSVDSVMEEKPETFVKFLEKKLAEVE